MYRIRADKPHSILLDNERGGGVNLNHIFSFSTFVTTACSLFISSNCPAGCELHCFLSDTLGGKELNLGGARDSAARPPFPSDTSLVSVAATE